MEAGRRPRLVVQIEAARASVNGCGNISLPILLERYNLNDTCLNSLNGCAHLHIRGDVGPRRLLRPTRNDWLNAARRTNNNDVQYNPFHRPSLTLVASSHTGAGWNASQSLSCDGKSPIEWHFHSPTPSSAIWHATNAAFWRRKEAGAAESVGAVAEANGANAGGVRGQRASHASKSSWTHLSRRRGCQLRHL